ncbi:MAG: RraA family protein [Chloroflexota bacterium]
MSEFPTLFRQKFNTAVLSDAAFRVGATLVSAPSTLLPLNLSMKVAGPIVTVQANNDLVSIITAVHQAQPGDVIIITNQTQDVAVIGDLIATEAKRKGLGGFVIDGFVRDTVELIEIGVPVFCNGRYPIGPLKLSADAKGIGEIGKEIHLGHKAIQSGMWAFGDADGVLFLQASDLPAIFGAAEDATQREAALTAKIEAGTPLGDLLAIDSFLKKRAADPQANFNEHIASLGQAI